MHLSSSMSSHHLIARFLLVLNNIPLSGGPAVYLPIHPLKDNLVASKFWQYDSSQLMGCLNVEWGKKEMC